METDNNVAAQLNMPQLNINTKLNRSKLHILRHFELLMTHIKANEHMKGTNEQLIHTQIAAHDYVGQRIQS